jgi:hypothetical protein
VTYPDSNGSYQALSLLGRFFSSESNRLHKIWEALKNVLQESNNNSIRFRDDSWEQDWLLAKYGAEALAIGTRAWYKPPDDFCAFPTFDVDIQIAYLEDRGTTVRATKAAPTPSKLFAQEAPSTFVGPMVLDDFYELQQRIRAHGDSAMAQLNQTLAWLNTGLGRLFGGIALTSDIDLQTSLALLMQRWSRVWEEKDVYEEHMSIPEILQWKLDVFYGAEIAPERLVMQPSRQGQPWQWQKYWQWLGHGVDPSLALEATRMAAKLMVCPPILVFLKSKLRGTVQDEVTLDHLLALSVLRRLALQLQVMSWLEMALQHSFRHIRVEDLTSFAYSALRPHWPRRLFAVSHRSRDVKPALLSLNTWGNFRCSLDALFAPHWETNVATVWGLFSAVPGLIRVTSEHYEESKWCRRECEIFGYLCEHDDFLEGRRVVEMPDMQLHLLDAMVPPSPAEHRLVKPGQFPPLTSVFMLFPFEAWECRLLACAAAVRFILLKVRDVELATRLCRHLAQGLLPPSDMIAPLTNHVDGWSPIVALFQAFQREWGDRGDAFPLAPNSGQYSHEEMERDIASAELLTDLSDGLVDQAAALAALEWNRTVVPSLIGDYRYGSFFAVDYRRITQERWRTDECMVIRGVGRVRTSVPLWILQSADQRVDEWPGFGANPIFTQHVAKQWSWMNELLQEPEWPEVYRKECGLTFSQKLTAACAATKNRGSSHYKGKIG